MSNRHHDHSHHHHGSHGHAHGPASQLSSLAGPGLAVNFLAAGLVQRLLWLLPLLAVLWGLIAWALLSE